VSWKGEPPNDTRRGAGTLHPTFRKANRRPARTSSGGGPPETGSGAVSIVWGLREIGEPARKALIVSLLPAPVRAQGVGLYWGIRGVAICWASLVGALVWFWRGPEALLYLAFAFGCAGAAVFYLWVRALSQSSEPEVVAAIDA
jgi:hypothetical protein